MDLGKAIKSRKSVRKFSSKKPDWRDIIECIDYLRYSPTAGNNFALKIILVDDKEKIKDISKACQQDFVGQVDYIIVICSDNTRLVNSYGKRGEIYSRQQAGASIQNLLLKIQEHGLSTCWVGHFVDEQIKRTLKIPSNVDVEAVFPIGYELGKTKQSFIPDLDPCLYFNTYRNKKMQRPNRTD